MCDNNELTEVPIRKRMPLFALPVMLFSWCSLRVTYITVAIRFMNEPETVSRAYPITRACSSVIYLIYFFTADWLHAFDKEKTVPRWRR